MALELGAGYVTLLPSARGFGAKVRALTSREMKGAGTAAGDRFTREMSTAADKSGRRFPTAVSKHTRQVTKDTAKDGREAGSRFGSAMKTGALAGMAGLGVAAGAFMRSAIAQASEAQQGDGAVEAIFGKMDAGKIKKQAEAAGAQYGLSYSEYVNKAANNAAFLKNKGVTGDALVKQTEKDMRMAADLAAQYGGTTAEAIDAILSARKGETDPIERYGISLNETAVSAKAAELGLKKVNGQYTDADKLAARNAILVTQSKDATGAAAREADTYAGAQMRAKAAMDNLGKSVGEAFLPVLSSASKVLAETVVPAVSGFVQGMKDGTGAGGKFVGFMRALQPYVLPIAAGIGAAATAFVAYRTGAAIATLATKLFSKALLANPLGLVVAAIGLLVGALVHLYRTNDKARAVMDAAWLGIRTAVKVAWEVVIKPSLLALWGFIKNTLVPVILSLWRNVVKPAFGFIGSIIKVAWERVIKPALGGLGSAIKALPGVFDKAQKGIAKAWSAIKAAALKPVEFVVQTVLNFGLISGMNKIMDGLKLPKDLRIPYIPWTAKLASGGIVPGHSPNPTADNIPAMLTAGEFVTRHSAAQRMRKKHPGALEYINEHGELPRYARGGWAKPWPMAVGAAVRKMFGHKGAQGGYGARPGPSDHGTGNAIDFMVPDSGPLGDAIAAWGAANHEALRLKYVIWKKQIIGSGQWGRGWRPYTRYGKSKNRTLQHYDHPHFSFEHGKWGNPAALLKGLTPEAMEMFKRGMGAAGDSFGFVNPFASLLTKATDGLKQFGGSESLMGQIASGAAKNLIGAIPQWATDKMSMLPQFMGGSAVDNPDVTAPAGNAVLRWRDTVVQALGRAGLPTSEPYVNAWLRQIKSESGGDHNVAQRIHDRNGTGASAGVGLVQVIPGTFAAYRDKGLANNRRDPLANLTAGMRWAKSRYGSRMLSVIGRGHGYAKGGFVEPTLYDTGGILAPGLTLVSNQTNKPETVRTFEQEKALQADLGDDAGTVININGIKHDSVSEFANELNFALTRRANTRRYGKG